MSYDISLCDPVTHKPLKADSTHFIAGGMRAMGGTKELWLNITPIITVTSIIAQKYSARVESAPFTAKQAQRASQCLKKLFLH